MENGTAVAQGNNPEVNVTLDQESDVNLGEASGPRAEAAAANAPGSDVLSSLDNAPQQGKRLQQGKQEPPLRSLDTVEKIRALQKGRPQLVTSQSGLNGISRSDIRNPFNPPATGLGEDPSKAALLTNHREVPTDWHKSPTGAYVWNVIKPSELITSQAQTQLVGRQQTAYQGLVTEYLHTQVEVAALRRHVGVLENFRDAVNLQQGELDGFRNVDRQLQERAYEMKDRKEDLDAKITEKKAKGEPTREEERSLRRLAQDFNRAQEEAQVQWERQDTRTAQQRSDRVVRLEEQGKGESQRNREELSLNREGRLQGRDNARRSGYEALAEIDDSNRALGEGVQRLNQRVNNDLRNQYEGGKQAVSETVFHSRELQRNLATQLGLDRPDDLLGILDKAIRSGIDFPNKENLEATRAFLRRDMTKEAVDIIHNGYSNPTERALEGVAGLSESSVRTVEFKRYTESLQGVRVGADPTASLQRDTELLFQERDRLLGEVVEIGGEIATIPGVNSQHLRTLSGMINDSTRVTAQAQGTYEREVIQEGRNLALHDVLTDQGNRLAEAIHRQEDVTRDWRRDVESDYREAEVFMGEFRRVMESNETLGGIVSSAVGDAIKVGTDKIKNRVNKEVGDAIGGVLNGIFGK